MKEFKVSVRFKPNKGGGITNVTVKTQAETMVDAIQGVEAQFTDGTVYQAQQTGGDA